MINACAEESLPVRLHIRCRTDPRLTEQTPTVDMEITQALNHQLRQEKRAWHLK